MRRVKILSRSTRVSEMPFEEFYDNISSEWQDKARRLQARRWRKLKHQLV